jgi:hypothetical protein
MQTSKGYIFCILQHFVTKFCNFTDFNKFFTGIYFFLPKSKISLTCKLSIALGKSAMDKTLRLVLPKKNKSTCINKLVAENKEIIDPKQIANALNPHFVGIGNSVLSEAYPDQVKISTPTENLN